MLRFLKKYSHLIYWYTGTCSATLLILIAHHHKNLKKCYTFFYGTKKKLEEGGQEGTKKSGIYLIFLWMTGGSCAVKKTDWCEQTKETNNVFFCSLSVQWTQKKRSSFFLKKGAPKNMLQHGGLFYLDLVCFVYFFCFGETKINAKYCVSS